MSTLIFPAFRFDGRQAEALPVGLRVESKWLIVETAEGAVLDREALDGAIVSEPFDHAPRLISLDSGATLEVPDEDRGFARALEHAGVRPSLAVRLQEWWPAVIVAVAALVSLLALAYLKGLPAAARWAAFALPARFESRMGDQLLEVFDRHHFEPSRLDGVQRAQISERFARVAAAIAPQVPYRLEFRATRKPSVNAMALPGGVVILLDGLVQFAGNEDVVLGVLGHEFGHVVHKHVTRQIFQAGGVGVLAGLRWGDFSSVAASLPVALGTLRYTREFEREADEFALALLRAQNVSTQTLYEFFVRLQAMELRMGVADIPDFLSAHPATEERLKRLRQGDSP
jgi:predicted Zn-dependent protease